MSTIHLSRSRDLIVEIAIQINNGEVSASDGLKRLFREELLEYVTDPNQFMFEKAETDAAAFLDRGQRLPRWLLFYDLYCRVAQDLRLHNDPVFDELEAEIFEPERGTA